LGKCGCASNLADDDDDDDDDEVVDDEAVLVEWTFVAAVDPDAPAIGSIAVGENSANVSWSPSEREHANNPGSRFYVEYVKASDAGLRLSPSYSTVHKLQIKASEPVTFDTPRNAYNRKKALGACKPLPRLTIIIMHLLRGVYPPNNQDAIPPTSPVFPFSPSPLSPPLFPLTPVLPSISPAAKRPIETS